MGYITVTVDVSRAWVRVLRRLAEFQSIIFNLRVSQRVPVKIVFDNPPDVYLVSCCLLRDLVRGVKSTTSP